VPVLYTSLSAPAAGFAPVEGQATISEHQPMVNLSVAEAQKVQVDMFGESLAPTKDQVLDRIINEEVTA
jgi:hypothetical protein